MDPQILEQWALSHGATLHQNVEVHEDDSCFSLRTKADKDGIAIPAKKPIVSCPLSLSLSAFNAFFECPLSRLINREDPTRFPQIFLDKTPFHIMGRFFLCQQYLMSKDSFWFPYISSLPQPGRDEYRGGRFDSNDAERLGTPLFWTEDDLKWIRGTNMDAARLERLALWQQEWNDGCEILRDEKFANLESYTYNLYGWASTIFSSRCFVSSLLPDHALENESYPQWMERARKEHNSTQILFPLVDLANHDPTAKLSWKVDKSPVPSSPANIHNVNGAMNPIDSITSVDAFQIIAENNIPAGQEVFNNYGSIKYNSELLLGYGFCLPDIKNDYIALEFINAGWLEAAHRTWQSRSCYSSIAEQHFVDSSPQDTEIKRKFVLGWKTRSSAEERPGITKEFQMFEHGLFDLLAIELANISEKAYIAENPSLCLETVSPEGPLARLLLATTSAIVEKLEHDSKKIMKYGDLGDSKTTAQHHAKIYREGQLLLLNHRITALEEHLKNAYNRPEYRTINGNQDYKTTVTLWTLQRAFDSLENWQNGPTELKEILQTARQVLELEPHESFHGSEVIEAGWDSALWILCLCINSAIPLLLEREREQQQKHSLYINDIIHIQQWIRHMENKYPVGTDPPRLFLGDDQERQTLIDIFGGSKVTEDDGGRRGERICWASHVVREETIRVPKVWREDGGEEIEMRQLVMCVGK